MTYGKFVHVILFLIGFVQFMCFLEFRSFHYVWHVGHTAKQNTVWLATNIQMEKLNQVNKQLINNDINSKEIKICKRMMPENVVMIIDLPIRLPNL